MDRLIPLFVFIVALGLFFLVISGIKKIITLKKEHDLFKARAIEWWFLPQVKHYEELSIDLFNQTDSFTEEDKKALMQKIDSIYCHNISNKTMAELKLSLSEIRDAYEKLRFN